MEKNGVLRWKAQKVQGFGEKSLGKFLLISDAVVQIYRVPTIKANTVPNNFI